MSAGLPTDDPWGDRQQGLALDALRRAPARRPAVRLAAGDARSSTRTSATGSSAGSSRRGRAGVPRRRARPRLLEPLGMTRHGLPRRRTSPTPASPTATSAATTPGSRSRSTRTAPWPRWAACSRRSATSPAGWPGSPTRSRPATTRRAATRSAARAAARCSRSTGLIAPSCAGRPADAAPDARRRRPTATACRPGDDLTSARIVGPRGRLPGLRVAHALAPGVRASASIGARQPPLRAGLPRWSREALAGPAGRAPPAHPVRRCAVAGHRRGPRRRSSGCSRRWDDELADGCSR